MSDKPTVVPFKGLPDGFKASMDKIEKDFPQLVRWSKIRSKMLRTYYDSAIAENFTPQEAMVIALEALKQQ